MDKNTISFENAIKKNHDQLKVHLRALLSIISNLKLADKERVDQVKAHCMNVVRHCNTLQDILSAEDRPEWLIQILKNCKLYMNNEYEPKPFTVIFDNYPKVINHEWIFNSAINGVDFDSIYQKYKEESELPQLIDELISLLEKLIKENGDELQTKTLNDLTKLLKTIIQNKKGSSTAIESSLFLVYEFFKNTFFTLFPAVQITADGINTVKKIGNLIHDALVENKKIQQKVISKTQKNFSNSITYSANGIISDTEIIPPKVLEHYLDEKA